MVLVLQGGGTKPFSRLRSERQSRRGSHRPLQDVPLVTRRLTARLHLLKVPLSSLGNQVIRCWGPSRSNYCFSLRGQSKSDRCHSHPALEFSLSWSFLAACFDKDAEIETSDIQGAIVIPRPLASTVPNPDLSYKSRRGAHPAQISPGQHYHWSLRRWKWKRIKPTETWR